MDTSVAAHTSSVGTFAKGIDLDSLEGPNPRKRAMIVDDEGESVDLLKFILTNAGMDVTGAPGGYAALEKLPRVWPDIILLDLMMPDMDGIEAFRRLRRVTSAPVIIISAKNRKEDVISGLQIGADDYITKPFHPGELVARIHSIIKHHPTKKPKTVLDFPAISLNMDAETRDVAVRGKTFSLPSREFQILSALARQASRWVSHENLAREVWGMDDIRTTRRIKYLIFLLRQKLEEVPSHPRLILSREGLGYKLDAHGEPSPLTLP
ncbi:MAG: response regulator transcription factor [Anaerolineaceae bacterium]